MCVCMCRVFTDWEVNVAVLGKSETELVDSKMEWTTVQHLDLRHVGRGLKPLQPHAAAFHPHQALVAVAIGNFLIGQIQTHFRIFFSFFLLKNKQLKLNLAVQTTKCACYGI